MDKFQWTCVKSHFIFGDKGLKQDWMLDRAKDSYISVTFFIAATPKAIQGNIQSCTILDVSSTFYWFTATPNNACMVNQYTRNIQCRLLIPQKRLIF